MKYQGGCHCGAVEFEVELADHIECERCNCSICEMVGFIHVIVPKRNFHLRSDEQNLSQYTFNTHQAKHLFCKTCGVKPFYIPRSNPDGYSVNLRCLKTQPPHVEIVDFDGQNWEANAASLAHKSK